MAARSRCLLIRKCSELKPREHSGRPISNLADGSRRACPFLSSLLVSPVCHTGRVMLDIAACSNEWGPRVSPARRLYALATRRRLATEVPRHSPLPPIGEMTTTARIFCCGRPVSPHHPPSAHWRGSPSGGTQRAGTNSVLLVGANTGQLARVRRTPSARCVRPKAWQQSQPQMTLSWLFVLARPVTRHTVSSRKHLPDVDQARVFILDSSFAVQVMIAVVRSTTICMFSGSSAPSPTW